MDERYLCKLDWIRIKQISDVVIDCTHGPVSTALPGRLLERSRVPLLLAH